MRHLGTQLAVEGVPRVMVVEDEDATREAMAELLGYEGFVVTAARDGVEALDLLAGDCLPDVILLDWRMPRMDGSAFLRAVASDQALARIPVVVCSADGRYVREAATALGACRVLAKPLDLRELLDSLATACSTRAETNGQERCPLPSGRTARAGDKTV